MTTPENYKIVKMHNEKSYITELKCSVSPFFTLLQIFRALVMPGVVLH